MATAKQAAHGMVTYFVEKYTEKYRVKPTLNRYKARWGFEDILMDMEYNEAKALVDYYFGTISTNGHSVDWFLYNYDKLAVAMEEAKKDADELKVIREASRRRTEEWRKKNGIS